ncbi:hypothetical protein SAMN02910435_00616 [Ruminococcaceae bacterium D5]|nr:hypothetical protein SAMN02910435_00616 [Ruminococcaceae bacterium D5]
MTGTIVNAAAVVAGGALGLCLRRGLPERVQDAAMQAGGLGVAMISLGGIFEQMLTAGPDGLLTSGGGMLLVLSLVLGGMAGEVMRIEDRVVGLGQAVERRLGREGFAKGFVSASLLFCVGAMAILGSIQDGLYGRADVLFTKAVLDGIFSVMMAASLGYGVIFSAVPLFLYQGAITLGASMLGPLLDGTPLLGQICMVGYCVVLLIGTNMMGVTKVKTANYLPAIFGPVVYNLIMMLKNIW